MKLSLFLISSLLKDVVIWFAILVWQLLIFSTLNILCNYLMLLCFAVWNSVVLLLLPGQSLYFPFGYRYCRHFYVPYVLLFTLYCIIFLLLLCVSAYFLITSHSLVFSSAESKLILNHGLFCYWFAPIPRYIVPQVFQLLSQVSMLPCARNLTAWCLYSVMHGDRTWSEPNFPVVLWLIS